MDSPLLKKLPFEMSCTLSILDSVSASSVFIILLLVTATANQVRCLNINYRSFPENVRNNFIFEGQSNMVQNILQVTNGLPGENLSANLSGRILYRKKLKLWRKSRRVSSFNTRFVLAIAPQSNPPGEGLAFILTRDPQVPENSYGQWLGITNAGKDSFPGNNIVAFEFDTRKSFREDVDNNHFGVNINSIKSNRTTSLTQFGVNLSSLNPITAIIDYDGTKKMVNVSVSMHKRGAHSKILILSMPLDLSRHLSEDVYVGFSASTRTGIQLNCISEWYFSSSDIEKYNAAHFYVAVLIPLISVICMGSLACCIYRRMKWKRKCTKNEDGNLDVETQCSMLGPKKYRFKELKVATSNFNSRNELGRGGFGIVYKGVLNGKEAAIKRITKSTKQGKKNLIAEVTSIGGIHHKNLVDLMGWCYENTELLLVYEFMPNKSLDMLIFCDDPKPEVGGSTTLNWKRRHTIICGVAQAIDYLHNECSKRVLHQDIKTSNVLLDAELNACLGDFGLARTFKLGDKTHHTSIDISGTPGYMAPEIFLTGRSTTETDVYAFGVLMLEVACGRKLDIQTKDDEFRVSIIDWVWEFHKHGRFTDAIDPKLNGQYDKKQAECMLALGLACCHPNPYIRPSMRITLQALSGEVVPPDFPLEKPAFMWPANAPCTSRTMDLCFSGGIMSTSIDISGR